MTNQKSGLYIGAAIIVIGVLALLVNINVLDDIEELFGGALLLLGALIFYSIYNRDRTKWWPLLPGAVLAVLGVGVMLDAFLPFASDFLGAAFMYAIFAVFALVFTRDRNSWWAVIPAGITFTLGTIILIDTFDLLDSDLNGVILFLGMGLTFFYLWSLRRDIANLNWAIWPAAALLALSILVYVNEIDWVNEEYIFPLLVILVGVLIIVFGKQNKK